MIDLCFSSKTLKKNFSVITLRKHFGNNSTKKISYEKHASGLKLQINREPVR